jgi:hypothetical protein
MRWWVVAGSIAVVSVGLLAGRLGARPASASAAATVEAATAHRVLEPIGP